MASPHIPQKRSLSQVFLQERWPLDKIADQLVSWQSARILEIGPGSGVLTKVLCARKWPVTAVEKDARFAESLTQRIQENSDRLEVVNQDILQFDLATWLGRSTELPAVVGNIPYNISSPIVLWLLPHLTALCGACLMVQREYAERLAGIPGHKSYGSLSVYTQIRADVSIAFDIARTCFRPVPQVDSSVVTLTPRKIPLCDPQRLLDLEQLTRLAFTQRRKKMRNSIQQLLRNKDEKLSPIDLDRRPDSLSPAEYLSLAGFIFSTSSDP